MDQLAEEYVMIYTHEGTALAEIEPASLKRSWELNGVGVGTVTLPLDDPKLDSDLIKYGNFITIHSNILPLWAGVILPPTKLTPTGVEFSIYSGEALLRKRPIPRANSRGGPASLAFKQIIQYVHRHYQSNLRVGNITEGREVELEEYYRYAWDLVQILVELSNEDFYIEPEIVKNRLYFDAHWLPRRGKNRSHLVRLEEGHNVAATFSMEEVDDISNEVFVIGKGDDWATKPIVHYANPDLVGLYGRWVDIVEAHDTTAARKLFKIAEKWVKEHGMAKFRLLVEIIDIAGVVGQFDIGDVVAIELPSFQYSPSFIKPMESEARILGYAFDIRDGTLPVVVESYLEYAQSKVGR